MDPSYLHSHPRALERYTLLAVCGLAVVDTDTDGRMPTQASGIPAARLNAGF